MEKIRIGINGFGRIGRAIFRQNHLHQRFEVGLINDLNPDLENLAYQLRYDSIYGNFPASLKTCEGKLILNEQSIAIRHSKDPQQVDWREQGIDVLIDASGVSAHPGLFLEQKHVAEKVIFTHAVHRPDEVKTVVFGVNDEEENLKQHRYYSTSICDTVAAAPILHTLQNEFGVHSGALTTLHPWLGLQHLQDGSAIALNLADEHRSNYALGRSAINNLIPKSTTAIHAAELILPGIAQKISAFSYRVPTNIVSSAVLNLELGQTCTRNDILASFARVEHEQKWKIISNCFEPRVSIDYCACEYSAAIDQRWTHVDRGRHLRMVYWYDNEWGYSARVLDLVQKIMQA